MKDILRRLLEAEDAGRLAAKAKEVQAEAIVGDAERVAAELAARASARAAEELAELERQYHERTQCRRREVAEQTDATLDHLAARVRQRSAASVERLVAMLLGESEQAP